MPKPQGTYLRIQANSKSAAVAEKDKKIIATGKDRNRDKFYELLDKISESRLKAWHREMNKLRAALKKSEPLAQEDKIRKAVADMIGEVRKVVVQVKDFRSFEASLQRPAEVIVRAPSNLGADGALLSLVIALCQILEILVRIRGKKAERA